MKTEKIIETNKIAATEVEWNYPLDYTIALNEAAELLEKQVPGVIINMKLMILDSPIAKVNVVFIGMTMNGNI